MTLSDAQLGLCADCQWARLVQTRRGSRFLRCALANEDARFVKYPRLPVRRCNGFRPRPHQPSAESDHPSC